MTPYVSLQTTNKAFDGEIAEVNESNQTKHFSQVVTYIVWKKERASSNKQRLKTNMLSIFELY